MNEHDYPPSDWLKRRMTFDEAEEASRAEAREFNLKPAAAWLERWADFKGKYEPGDELWYFEWFPGGFAGAAGYCIRRGEQNIAYITTKRR